ncbi:hypothetical protein [Streptomyces vietnamensis]|nr:hypothetical protein [Streptomyces vietnamensis]
MTRPHGMTRPYDGATRPYDGVPRPHGTGPHNPYDPYDPCMRNRNAICHV